MERILNKLRGEPVEFVAKILGATADPWQRDALNTLSKSARLAIRSGHGVGKTCLEAWCVLWFLFTRPDARVVMTAPTIRQLYDILMAELSKWLKRSELLEELFEWQKTKVIFKATPENYYAVARTAAKPENLQGFHAEHLLFILDEASGIGDDIFEAVEGALTGTDNKLLMCGNPTRNSGFFYRAFHEDRDIYATMKVSSAESGRVSNEYCKRLIKQYGEDSDVVRVRVLGEFPKSESDGVIPLEWIEAAMMRESARAGELILGVDVARQGNDLTAVAVRLGDDCLAIKTWRHADLMTTTGRIIHLLTELMTKYKKSRAELRIDDDGLGAGVTDRLKEVVKEKNIAAQVIGCHNGGKPRDNRYSNFISEAMFALRERLEQKLLTLPRDDNLAAELSTRHFSLNSADRIILEPKSQYKKRLGRSPDRADAVALAFAPMVSRAVLPSFVAGSSYWH